MIINNHQVIIFKQKYQKFAGFSFFFKKWRFEAFLWHEGKVNHCELTLAFFIIVAYFIDKTINRFTEKNIAGLINNENNHYCSSKY